MKKKNQSYQIVLHIVFILMCAVIIFPLFLLFSVSFSKESDIVYYGYSVLPKTFTLDAYRYVFQQPASLLDAYKVTILFSVVGTFLSVLLMAMLAHTLSKRGLKGRGVISFAIYFTMLFSGGLVPSYILCTEYLHLNDTIWIYILPSMISPWYTFMIRTFFQGLPEEISESAEIDGASEYTIFFRIILPLSKPVLATVALFTFLGKWNEWYTAMLYINDEKLVSLQYMLQRIMNNIALLQNEQFRGMQMIQNQEVPAETVRMAMAVLVAGPALVVFPFFQKYFVQGLTVGAVKG